MKTKINEAISKFNSADENNDGELNIDEYNALKEDKAPVQVVNETPLTNPEPQTTPEPETMPEPQTESEPESSSNVVIITSDNRFEYDSAQIHSPQLTKVQREEQALEIVNPIHTYITTNYGIWGDKERRLGYEKALEAVKKINKSNIAEVINYKFKYHTSFGWITKTGINRVLFILNREYENSPDLLNNKIRRLYSLLEQRAFESNCLNRFNNTRESAKRYIGDRQHDKMLTMLANVVLEAEQN